MIGADDTSPIELARAGGRQAGIERAVAIIEMLTLVGREAEAAVFVRGAASAEQVRRQLLQDKIAGSVPSSPGAAPGPQSTPPLIERMFAARGLRLVN